MKTKIITAIIAFAATFLTSAALTGLFVGNRVPPATTIYRIIDAQTQQKILTLLRQDINNGEERFGKLSQIEYYSEPFSTASLPVYSKAVSEYQTKSASMDDADLPSDFQAAWRQHMKAWRDHGILVEQLKKSAENENMSVDEIYEELRDQSNDINRTWYKVLRIASKYNANPYEVE
ncbi:MAG: hypothetical protein ABI954_02885 [Pyrinomonadaceae bacterium]